MKELKDIKGIATNSKDVQKNYVFFALKGKNNGENFIDEALERGASLIVTDLKYPKNNNSQFLQVEDVRKTLGKFLSEFYPDKPENLVAVSGTCGKTSVVHFFKDIISIIGKKSACIGTLNVTTSDNFTADTPSSLTTPGAVKLHQILSSLKAEDYNYVALEASSHGLKQERLYNLDFRASAFTNFSQDHLDYHLNMEDYFNSKMILFKEIMKQGSFAIINSDIKEFEIISKYCSHLKIIEYGTKARDLQLIDIKDKYFTVKYLEVLYKIENPLISGFQIYNLLASIGLVLALGFDAKEVFAASEGVKQVPGRLEKVFKDYNIFVDYAHKPDALLKVLKELQGLKTQDSKIIVVFGCGGNRDRGKRKIMGEIAGGLADIVIVTDDNPRFEDPDLIRKEILEGCPGATQIGDRREAIESAIKAMNKDDILLIAGKGHEKYQIIKDETLEFDDVKIVKDFFKEQL